MSKKKYLTVSELSNDIEQLHKTLNESSDTVCVLVASSYIDKCLANSLVIRMPLKDKNFIKNDLLESNNGVLATYSSKNKIAYSLGIIDKSYYEDISYIGKIRNNFAHNHLEISFRDTEIINFCNKLTLWEDLFPPFERDEYKTIPQCNSSQICKMKFIDSAVEIINKFVGQGLIHKIVYQEDI